MPRLPPTLFRHAYSIDTLLPALLPVCRDLRSARNELRWLREHAIAKATTPLSPPWKHRYQKLVADRATGKPLQYVLGTQPFGTLEILCEPGVLIPRSETESLATHLAAVLSRSTFAPKNNGQKPLRILDLCTGSGCIALLLHSLLAPHHPHLSIQGIDICPTALALANKNKEHNIKLGLLNHNAAQQAHFSQDDIFTPLSPSNPETTADPSWPQKEWDILISNPPYISPRSFATTTSKSVRDWEPISALLPDPSNTTIPKRLSDDEDSEDAIVLQGDTFYPRLLAIATQVSAKMVLFEVADLAQAKRVAGMVLEVKRRGQGWEGCEIWRDWLGHSGGGRAGVTQPGGEKVRVANREVDVRGEGNGRAVLAWRKEGGVMLRRR